MASENEEDPHLNEDFQFDLDSAAVRPGGQHIVMFFL
jgi:hypothetical protein